MSTLFNGNNFVLPFEDHTVNLKAKASTNIAIGDFVCWDAANKVLVPVDVNVAGVTDSAANIAASFAGVASQTELSVNTNQGYPVFPAGYNGISVQVECLYNADIASGAVDAAGEVDTGFNSALAAVRVFTTGLSARRLPSSKSATANCVP